MPPSSITSRRVAAFTSRTGSTVPPASRGRKIEKPMMSKDIEPTSGILVELSMPASRVAHLAKLTSPRCSISTPLGAPVEPDV
jgi:hypothetical protein